MFWVRNFSPFIWHSEQQINHWKPFLEKRSNNRKIWHFLSAFIRSSSTLFLKRNFHSLCMKHMCFKFSKSTFISYIHLSIICIQLLMSYQRDTYGTHPVMDELEIFKKFKVVTIFYLFWSCFGSKLTNLHAICWL